jgi:hypothetical protein
MTTKNYLSNAFHLTFNYAGRGLVLGALAMSLAFAGCDDGDPEQSDAAVDAAAGGDGGQTFTDAKAADTASVPDAGKDSSTPSDAKPADAGVDASTADAAVGASNG